MFNRLKAACGLGNNRSGAANPNPESGNSAPHAAATRNATPHNPTVSNQVGRIPSELEHRVHAEQGNGVTTEQTMPGSRVGDPASTAAESVPTDPVADARVAGALPPEKSESTPARPSARTRNSERARPLPEAAKEIFKESTKDNPNCWGIATEIFLSSNSSNEFVAQRKQALVKHFGTLANDAQSLKQGQDILVMKDFDTEGIDLAEIAALFIVLQKAAPALAQIKCIAFQGGQHDAVDASQRSKAYEYKGMKITIHVPLPSAAHANGAARRLDEDEKDSELDDIWTKLARLDSNPNDADPAFLVLRNTSSLSGGTPAAAATRDPLAPSPSSATSTSSYSSSLGNSSNWGPVPGSKETQQSSSSASIVLPPPGTISPSTSQPGTLPNNPSPL